MTTVFINGRFLAQPATGVQRFAKEVLWAVDDLLCERDRDHRFCLLLPRDAGQIPEYRNIRTRQIGRLRGVPWEQLELPRAAGSGLLLNLGSTGPLAHGRQLVTIHDASIFRYPQNFSRSFVLWYRILIPMLGRRPVVY